MAANLTPAQERYLAEIRAAGTKSYNGRSFRPLWTLKCQGLITLLYNLRSHNGGRYTEVWTATAVQKTEAVE